ncbi:hypothetical protein OHB26_34855 [Nocardia sp. NBC_01503]|uniref:hypothetical protein n=1 Tax=Nocardia sp. NBC_01503 TaxID=2975997 RepID=UPI002E7B18B3|nr:hypothetical protein [Nocardia sp. NBC_01503]WTL32021.1 hypothetical protein OHB26_34855 [Nocardia sp. NBC_01503]
MGVRSRLPTAIRNGAEWARRFARTAPGVLSAVVVGLVALSVISGLVCANQLSEKLTRRDTVLTHSEPLANAAQRLYVALSAADATASSAFLSGNVESPDVRTRYRQALADAAAALAEATTGASDQQTRDIVANISADLPTYTGLVEAARANNRQGLPVGSAYLRQASALMQNSVLPDAERLQKNRLTHLRDDQRDISTLPLLSVILLLVLLLAFVAGSVVLLRHTNRRINLGVGTAAGATVLALLWIVIASIAATGVIDTGSDGATARFETLSRIRILAQQARTEETLQLIIRGDINDSENRFGTKVNELSDHLTTVTDANSPAATAFSTWQAGHNTEVKAYQANDYNGAVTQAIGGAPGSSATRFAALDDALRTELDTTRQQVRDGVDGAGGAFQLSQFGTLLLLIAAAAATAGGIWPRLKEFL